MSCLSFSLFVLPCFSIRVARICFLLLRNFPSEFVNVPILHSSTKSLSKYFVAWQGGGEKSAPKASVVAYVAGHRAVSKEPVLLPDGVVASRKSHGRHIRLEHGVISEGGDGVDDSGWTSFFFVCCSFQGHSASEWASAASPLSPLPPLPPLPSCIFPSAQIYL